MKSELYTRITRRSTAILATLAMAAIMIPAHATNLVVNGGFESTTGPGQIGFNTTVTGWSNTGGYSFLFNSGGGDTVGATSQFGPNVILWGPNSGSANGLPASSPNGGNYIGMDSDFQLAPLTQTLTGLTAGKTYAVTFDWAGAQQHGYDGLTTEGWTVGFGSDPTQSTGVVNDPNHGFVGWNHETFFFTADGSSDVLSFLAYGTPGGEPPFSLLDGVSVAQTPEPGSLALLATGLFGVGGMVRSRFKKVRI